MGTWSGGIPSHVDRFPTRAVGTIRNNQTKGVRAVLRIYSIRFINTIKCVVRCWAEVVKNSSDVIDLEM
jgi:hypothetical protein